MNYSNIFNNYLNINHNLMQTSLQNIKLDNSLYIKSYINNNFKCKNSKLKDLNKFNNFLNKEGTIKGNLSHYKIQLNIKNYINYYNNTYY